MLAFVLTTVAATAAEAGSLDFFVGMDFSRGGYGQDTDTDMLFVPVTAKYTGLPRTLKVTVPYLRITSPGNVVGSGDSTVVVDETTGARETADGIGDIIASVTYELTDRPLLELTGKVKFGTADAEKYLGTGENDYALQFDAIIGQGGVSPYLTAGYYLTGDTDQALKHLKLAKKAAGDSHYRLESVEARIEEVKNRIRQDEEG